jgi:hypothetical protein
VREEGAFGDHVILQQLGALAQPVVLGHAIHQHVLGRGGRVVLVAQGLAQVVEVLLFFGVHDFEAAAEAVLEAVLAGAGFAFFGGRAGGVLGVGAVSFDLGGGGHDFGKLLWRNAKSAGGSVTALPALFSVAVYSMRFGGRCWMLLMLVGNWAVTEGWRLPLGA